jgi:hypothetical protein
MIRSRCRAIASLVTLEDAAQYIQKLPKAEHEAEEWQAAIEALMLVARGGPTMLARIGVMRAQAQVCRHDLVDAIPV